MGLIFLTGYNLGNALTCWSLCQVSEGQPQGEMVLSQPQAVLNAQTDGWRYQNPGTNVYSDLGQLLLV